MHDLRLVGVHDDGEHLELTDSDGGTYLLAIDDRLRRTVRDRGRTPDVPGRVGRGAPVPTRSAEPEGTMRPREIQALLRSGVSIEEVCERSGWPTEKVERYAGPVQAERYHIAGLARELPLRGRGPGQDVTFDARVSSRLVARGVETEQVEWDAWKGDQGRWTVVCRFKAGGRDRQATWLFDPTDRTLSATDDEARWLSEDEQATGPVPAPRRREAPVYDVEAEGGIESGPSNPVTVRHQKGGSPTAAQLPSAESSAAAEAEEDGPVDLVSAMRERAGRRKRSRRGGRATPSETTDDQVPHDARPPERLDVDSSDGPPLGSHPTPEQVEADALEEDTTEDTTAQLDHDPVTGTGDLFADHDEGANDQDSASEPEPAPAPPRKKRGRKRSGKKASAPAGPPRQAVAEEPEADVPVEAEQVPVTEEEQSETVASREVDGADSDEPPSRPSSARRGRPAVPSWDDIMFGSRSPSS